MLVIAATDNDVATIDVVDVVDAEVVAIVAATDVGAASLFVTE